MSPSNDGYEFADGIPLDPIDPGATLLVAGPALSKAEELARSLVADSVYTDEGGLFISTNTTSKKLLKACNQTHSSLDTTRLGIVDCSGQGPIQFRDDVHVKYISTQSDLTGIGIKFTALYESLYPNVAEGRIRTGVISLSSLLMYVDMRKLFQFAQTLSGRIESAEGLGVLAIDPTIQDTKSINTFSQVTDGRIEVREPEEPEDGTDGELRVRGLPNQPSGWQPFSL